MSNCFLGSKGVEMTRPCGKGPGGNWGLGWAARSGHQDHGRNHGEAPGEECKEFSLTLFS